jgi:hypothetical protein
MAECNCELLKSIEAAYSSSDLVISGRVTEVKSCPVKKGYSKVLVQTFRKLKGGDELFGDTVTIYTPEEDAKCGYGFAPSNEYLIYATGSPAFFKTTKCSRTTFLETSLKEVSTLSKLSGQE